MIDTEKYCFKSSLFQVEPGEDEETNPYIYGKQFSDWVAQRLRERGYEEAKANTEDWGWAVSCQSKPFYLYVACASFVDYDETVDPSIVPKPDEITWQCFVAAEKPMLRNPFKRMDILPDINKLQAMLFDILDSTNGITKVPEP